MLIIDAKKYIASFDVDAQRCFTPLCPEELPVPNGHEISDELNAQAKYASVRVGSKDAHPENAVWTASESKPQLMPVVGYEHVDLHWNKHAIPGSEGFKLLADLPHVVDYDFFVWKGVEPDMHPYGSCYHDLKQRLSTGVIEFLRAKAISTVIVGGLATDFCVRATVLQLLQAGFKVVVNLGACRGVAQESTEQAIKDMKEAGAEFVSAAAELKHHEKSRSDFN